MIDSFTTEIGGIYCTVIVTEYIPATPSPSRDEPDDPGCFDFEIECCDRPAEWLSDQLTDAIRERIFNEFKSRIGEV